MMRTETASWTTANFPAYSLTVDDGPPRWIDPRAFALSFAYVNRPNKLYARSCSVLAMCVGRSACSRALRRLKRRWFWGLQGRCYLSTIGCRCGQLLVAFENRGLVTLDRRRRCFGRWGMGRCFRRKVQRCRYRQAKSHSKSKKLGRYVVSLGL